MRKASPAPDTSRTLPTDHPERKPPARGRRPHPRRHQIALAHRAAGSWRRAAAILHRDLRRAADLIRAAGGRGARTALAVLEALATAFDARRPADLTGSAPAVCTALGLDVCDRAAREGLARLAAVLDLVLPGDRHTDWSIPLQSAYRATASRLADHPHEDGLYVPQRLACAKRERDSRARAYRGARAPGDSSPGTQILLDFVTPAEFARSVRGPVARPVATLVITRGPTPAPSLASWIRQIHADLGRVPGWRRVAGEVRVLRRLLLRGQISVCPEPSGCATLEAVRVLAHPDSAGLGVDVALGIGATVDARMPSTRMLARLRRAGVSSPERLGRDEAMAVHRRLHARASDPCRRPSRRQRLEHALELQRLGLISAADLVDRAGVSTCPRRQTGDPIDSPRIAGVAARTYRLARATDHPRSIRDDRRPARGGGPSTPGPRPHLAGSCAGLPVEPPVPPGPPAQRDAPGPRRRASRRPAQPQPEDQAHLAPAHPAADLTRKPSCSPIPSVPTSVPSLPARRREATSPPCPR